MKKTCEHCKYLYSGFHGEGICQLFGDDLPDWADNGNDGCLLKGQEIDKLIKLSEECQYSCYNYPRDINGNHSEEDKLKIEKIHKDYDNYLKEIILRCKKRNIA